MVRLLVTQMEMTAPPTVAAVAPRAGARVARERLGRDAYLALYQAVGEAVQWDQRLRLPPAVLDELLADAATHLHVLRVDGTAMGLCEFVGVGDRDVELANFGLVPAAQKQGLGSFLLNTALAACWDFAPRRIFLKTDTNDHPSAVKTYEKAGFRVVERRFDDFPD